MDWNVALMMEIVKILSQYDPSSSRVNVAASLNRFGRRKNLYNYSQ